MHEHDSKYSSPSEDEHTPSENRHVRQWTHLRLKFMYARGGKTSDFICTNVERLCYIEDPSDANSDVEIRGNGS